MSAVPIRAIEKAPNAEVVELLEDALSRAKNGEILGVAIAMHIVGADTAAGYAVGDGDVAHLTHALRRLEVRLLGFAYREMDE